jgi:hypothetical protein
MSRCFFSDDCERNKRRWRVPCFSPFPQESLVRSTTQNKYKTGSGGQGGMNQFCTNPCGGVMPVDHVSIKELNPMLKESNPGGGVGVNWATNHLGDG